MCKVVDHVFNVGWWLQVWINFCYAVWVDALLECEPNADLWRALCWRYLNDIYDIYVGIILDWEKHTPNTTLIPSDGQCMCLMPSQGETDERVGWLHSQHVRDCLYFCGVCLTISPYHRSLSMCVIVLDASLKSCWPFFFVSVISMFVILARFFGEVRLTTFPCLRTLRLYVISSLCFREIMLTIFPCFRHQLVRDFFSILRRSQTDHISLSPHSQFVRDFFSALPWNHAGHFSLVPSSECTWFVLVPSE